jgi:hypothetical protein
MPKSSIQYQLDQLPWARTSSESSAASEEDEALLKDAEGGGFAAAVQSAKSPLQLRPEWPWIMSTIFFGLSTAVLLVLLFTRTPRLPQVSHLPEVSQVPEISQDAQVPELSYFPTDLPDSRSVVEYETRRSTGALSWNQSSRRIVRAYDSDVEYFGSPSNDIDEAWKNLMRGEFPAMTEEEAQPYLPELKPVNGHFYFEYVLAFAKLKSGDKS